MTRPSSRHCAYCGAPNATETDHVPPKNLFASPRPLNLVTVPACVTCHRPTSRDDEYFRLMLDLRREVADQPDVKGGVLDAAMRSLQRPAARGLTTRFLRSLRMTELRSPAGLHLGTAHGYEPEPARVMAVVERTVRGLYFDSTGHPLGSDVGVRSLEDTLTDYTLISADDQQRLLEIVRALAGSDWRHIGSAFSYAYWLSPDGPRGSAWLMRFYGEFTFLSLTAPKDPTARVVD